MIPRHTGLQQQYHRQQQQHRGLPQRSVSSLSGYAYGSRGGYGRPSLSGASSRASSMHEEELAEEDVPDTQSERGGVVRKKGTAITPASHSHRALGAVQR